MTFMNHMLSFVPYSTETYRVREQAVCAAMFFQDYSVVCRNDQGYQAYHFGSFQAWYSKCLIYDRETVVEVIYLVVQR